VRSIAKLVNICIKLVTSALCYQWKIKVIKNRNLTKTQIMNCTILLSVRRTVTPNVKYISSSNLNVPNSLCNNCGQAKCGAFEHKPNVCVIHKVCLECLNQDVTPYSECKICGKNEIVFSGINTTNEFCQWLFFGENNGATILCHNFKEYDSFPIVQYLYQNGVLPKIVPSGAKNMSIEIPTCNIRMIDSINFLPMALSKLPKMF
jgi:hypothetical protein